jgi:hypothetical protein
MVAVLPELKQGELEQRQGRGLAKQIFNQLVDQARLEL